MHYDFCHINWDSFETVSKMEEPYRVSIRILDALSLKTGFWLKFLLWIGISYLTIDANILKWIAIPWYGWIDACPIIFSCKQWFPILFALSPCVIFTWKMQFLFTKVIINQNMFSFKISLSCIFTFLNMNVLLEITQNPDLYKDLGT